MQIKLTMDKYYTPEISEFHVGFEYEYLQPGGAWIKHNLDGTPIVHRELDEFTDDLMKLAHAITRVRYLTKSDIESLGWQLLTDEMRSRWNPQEQMKYYFESTNKELSYLNFYAEPMYSNRGLDIVGERIRVVIDYGFDGYIKNKSELSRIMKMLNINQ